MIIKGEETKEIKNKFGGKGSIFSKSYIQKNDFQGIDKVLEIVLGPHASIGYHQHQADSEIYHIISGNGEFQDADGEYKPVGPGDCCIITKGQSHGLVNLSGEPLKMMAIVF